MALLLGSLTPDLCEGVGQLLFEWCRGVPHQFHSCAESVLPLLLCWLASCEGEEEGEEGEGVLVFEALCVMVRAMAGHTKREFSEPVWKALLVSEGGREGEGRWATWR